jgi:probable DNA metabolism protein
MQIYRYDGSFEGFLTALAQCLDDDCEPSDFVKHGARGTGCLFSSLTTDVTTDVRRAVDFRDKFLQKASKGIFSTLQHAYLSEAPGVELLLWSYTKKAFRYGDSLTEHIAELDINKVGKLARNVWHEAQKFSGFVRFQEVNEGFLYATIEPQTNILAILARHFAGRLNDRPWFLHDVKRSQAAIFDTLKCRIVRNVTQISTPEFTEREQECRALWQGYFEHLAIAERYNPKLQQKHAPLHMRKHMIEFQHRNKAS